MWSSFITDGRVFDRLPARAWWPALKERGTLRADLLAGLTGAVVVLPQGVAFAHLAGMPPQYGLYTAMIPCIIAAFFGSSRQMVTGPANAISLTTLALVAPLAAAGSPRYVELVLTLTFMVGLLQLAAAFSGLAKWVDKVPHSVIVGFTTGAAVLIANSQIGNFFGLDFPRGRGVLANLRELVAQAGAIHWPSVFVAAVTFAACVLGRRIKTVIPYMLSAVVVGTLVYVLGRTWLPSLFNLRTVESFPSALPPWSVPSSTPADWLKLIMPALVMTLLALTEAMSIARAYALRSGQVLDSRQEMIGQGFANLAGAFFSSYPASGSFNRSGINVEAGARTPLAAISAGVLLMVMLLFVAPLFRYLPIACIAALLIMVAWTLIDWHFPREAWKAHRADFWVYLLTAVLTVTISLEWAILVGLACHVALGRFLGGSGASH